MSDEGGGTAKKTKTGRFREAFDRSFLIIAALAVATGTACYLTYGTEVFAEALAEDVELVAFLFPKLGAALLIAAFVQVLVPPKLLATYMGSQSGIRGMAIATAAGTVTPGGPMTAFPIVTVLRDGGTGIGALIAYLIAWSNLGLQRVMVWEIPLMGPEFAAVRFIASLPLAIIAGLLALVIHPLTGRGGDTDGERPEGGR